jgi:hypothetical protein
MPAKIYLHVGLPKTATTSLQLHVFPEIARRYNYAYVGVDQPREQHPQHHPLYAATLIAINEGEFQEFEVQLSKMSNFSGIIISEEMITVSTETVSWERKIKNLSKLLEAHKYEILVTLRHPKDAIFSYYLEQYEALKSEYPQFSSSIACHPYMEIYRYASFTQKLEHMFERQHIHYALFSQIIKDDFTSVLEFLKIDQSIKITMAKSNTKKTSEDHVYVKSKGSLYTKFEQYERTKAMGPIKTVLRIINRLITKPLL